MGKNRNKKKNKKCGAKSANNESETPVQSTSSTSEVKTDGKKFTNDNSRSIDDIQAKGYSTQNVPQEKKDTFRSRSDIRAVGQNLPISESDIALEAIKKLLTDIIEYIKAGKPLSEMSHLNNEELSMSVGQNSHTLDYLASNLNTLVAGRDPGFVKEVENYIIFQFELSYLMEKVSLSKDIENHAIAAAYKELKKSKERGDANAQVTTTTPELECGINELSLDLETDEKNKKTSDCDISADCIQKAAHTSHSVEGMKDGNKGTECRKKEKCFNEKIEKKNTNKRESRQKTIKKTKSDEESRRYWIEFVSLQSRKLEEQMRNCSDAVSETEFFEDLRDLLSTEKQSVIFLGEAGMTPEPKVYIIEVSTTIEQNHKPDKVIMGLNEMYGIKFEFYTNGNKFFKVYCGKVTYVLKEKDKLVFDFKNEKVQYSFSDGQILVSTPNNEFAFSVRKPQPVVLKNDTAQTYAKP